jgi:CRISPR/Cas system CSM-associated protein Csm2 small subunit
MENQESVVKEENQTPQVTNAETENTQEPVSGVTDTVSKNVYEKVREAMKNERAQKKEALSELENLRKRVEELEGRSGDENEEVQRQDPRLDVLYLVNKDPFVRENLDLIEQRMAENPRLDVKQAVREIKADMFDRIEKEISVPTNNNIQKTERPTAIREPVTYKPSGNALKDALEGKIQIPSEQLASIRRVLGK